MLTGDVFATVGISHLTTSRRHLDQPVLRAVATASGFVLSGYSPWVTGAKAAQWVVVGATMDDGKQILVALPTDLPGVEIPAPAPLVGLAASHTGPLLCHDVHIDREWLLAGPVHDVMKQGVGARTGGLQTSTLALGLARSALEFLEAEAVQRVELRDSAEALRSDWLDLRSALLQAAADQPVCTDADLRARANSLVLRASQSALAAAKGTGYVAGHPAGRWCREALFFLVWSCPQPVLAANLCEFAGIEG
jgi:alkylation response protein AidB-like acyl-CoA dehydrogenase